MAGHYAIALVCLGNICRSPMADVVLSQRVDDAGLAGRVTVTSSGTGDWHVGQPMDERAAAILRANDFDPSTHRAQQFAPSWLADKLDIGFHVTGFWPAVGGAIVITVVTWIVDSLIGES